MRGVRILIEWQRARLRQRWPHRNKFCPERAHEDTIARKTIVIPPTFRFYFSRYHSERCACNRDSLSLFTGLVFLFASVDRGKPSFDRSGIPDVAKLEKPRFWYSSSRLKQCQDGNVHLVYIWHFCDSNKGELLYQATEEVAINAVLYRRDSVSEDSNCSIGIGYVSAHSSLPHNAHASTHLNWFSRRPR